MKNKLKQIGIITATALMASASTAIAGYIYVVLYIVQPFQKEAVDRDYASWLVTDNGTGKTVFQWNDYVAEVNVLEGNDKPLN